MRTWKSLPIVAVTFAIALGAAIGCGKDAPVFSPTKTPGVNFSEDVSPYQLVFISRNYDSENDQTTYLYQLQNTLDLSSPAEEPPVIHTFTSVTVELPACAPAPVSYSPADGASIYTNPNGIYGIEWGVGYDENPDFYYSVRFPGDVPQGVVRGIVTTGGYTYVQDLAGPCEGTFQVAGTVFTDGDGDGLQGINELGVANVTVSLNDGETTQTVRTDSDGNYIFIAGMGSYTVSVDSVTADNTDFNETLFDAWNPTSPTFLGVTVGPDSFGNSFGFEPDVENILEAIDDDTYPTNGASFRWWRRQLRHALTCHSHDHADHLTFGVHHDRWYSADELLGFIHEIEALAIPHQYQFTPGQELLEAYRILNNHACTLDDGDDDDSYGDDRAVLELDVDGEEGLHHREIVCDPVLFLQRELLTTEFNHVTDRGLYTNFPLQYSLISWGEGLLADLPDDFFVVPGGENPASISNPLESGGQVFRKVNGATGGGGTGD